MTKAVGSEFHHVVSKFLELRGDALGAKVERLAALRSMVENLENQLTTAQKSVAELPGLIASTRRAIEDLDAMDSDAIMAEIARQTTAKNKITWP